MLERSIAIKPSYNALSNLGTLEYMEGDYAAAVEAYEAALVLHDHDSRIWGNLGMARILLGDNPEKGKMEIARAAELVEEQRAYMGNDPGLISRLASYYEELEQDERAVELLRNLVEMEPDNAEALFRIGQTYFLLEDMEKALEWLGRALDHGCPLSRIQTAPTLETLIASEEWRRWLRSRGDD